VPQRKLRFSKAQLRSLRFKLLNATFNRNFYEWIWYGTLNSSKAQLRFADCALVLQIAFCFCGATFL
jgi:hypothetical protein